MYSVCALLAAGDPGTDSLSYRVVVVIAVTLNRNQRGSCICLDSRPAFSALSRVGPSEIRPLAVFAHLSFFAQGNEIREVRPRVLMRNMSLLTLVPPESPQ